MLKKYISKFTMDILPSVAATIIGAYIVNHYIVTKPGVNVPMAAAVSTAGRTAEAKAAPEAAKPAGKAAETSADLAKIPEPGVKARGISEKAVLEKSAVEKPAEKSADKTEKPVDKPAETASIPTETRRHQPLSHERAIAKAVAAPVQSSAPVVAPVVAAPATTPAVEAAIAPEDHRDANDLARAAIERLRGASDGSSRAPEAAQVPDAIRIPPDTPRFVAAPVVPAPSTAAPPVRPLPPPIMVSTPASQTFDSSAGASQARAAYPAATAIDDPLRPTPPADIPSAPAPRPPLDLHADAREPPHEHTTVAEDVLSAAKSVFHAVLPK